MYNKPVGRRKADHNSANSPADYRDALTIEDAVASGTRIRARILEERRAHRATVPNPRTHPTMPKFSWDKETE